MKTAADARRRERNPKVSLIEGRNMVCPRCRRHFDLLMFKRLEMPVEFYDDLTPVYKCPREHGGCGYLFAPADDVKAGYLE